VVVVWIGADCSRNSGIGKPLGPVEDDCRTSVRLDLQPRRAAEHLADPGRDGQVEPPALLGRAGKPLEPIRPELHGHDRRRGWVINDQLQHPAAIPAARADLDGRLARRVDRVGQSVLQGQADALGVERDLDRAAVGDLEADGAVSNPERPRRSSRKSARKRRGSNSKTPSCDSPSIKRQ
jgi:hypothetical protein